MIERETDIRNIKRQLRELSEARFREQTNAKDFAHRLQGVLATRPGSAARLQTTKAEADAGSSSRTARRWWPLLLLATAVLALAAGLAWALLRPA